MIDSREFGWFLVIIFIAFYLFGKFAIYISTPEEFVVTKDMIPIKRIITDGVKVDTVLVYKFTR